MAKTGAINLLSFQQVAYWVPLAILTAICLDYTTAFGQATNEITRAISGDFFASGPQQPPSFVFWSWTEVRIVGAAFIVGLSGAVAFFVGVYLGFIFPDRKSRRRLLEYLVGSKDEVRWKWLFPFIGCGGVVAAVFQLAQPTVFAPIQAFVLGATWTSVVSRILTSNNEMPNTREWFNQDPATIQPPAGTSLTDQIPKVFIEPE